MQVSERTCNWRPGSAARAISFPPRCCLAYQPFGAIVTGPGETYPENPNDSLYPWLNGQVSLLWRLKWVSWLSGMYNQPNVVAFLYIIASTFYFTNSKKSGAVGNGNGDLSVTFCHTCCREAGTNDDSLIFSIPQAGAMSSRFAKVSGYIRSPSENPPDHEKCLYVSHVFSKKNMVSGIIWWVVWWVEQAQKNCSQLPRPGLPNCQ